MERQTSRLTETSFDLLVVGAGIYGACVARDAALRGLRVALIDRGDFGNATSHNSFKLIHGGLRYLQHLDLRRVRQSIEETRFWLRAAPHLVRPLQFVVPATGFGTRGPLAFWAAEQLHLLLGLDRNRGVLPAWRLPAGQVVSRARCLELIPGLDARRVTGGAVWYDGQMQNADRVLLECVLQAAEAGAEVANYVRAEVLLEHARRIEGVRARDLLSGEQFDVRATVTVNTCGPWSAELLQGRAEPTDSPALVKGMNLVTRRIAGDYAIGIESARCSDAVIGQSRRLYFITPWRDRSLIGTTHVLYRDEPDRCRFRQDEIEGFLREVNAAYPPANLKLDDVYYCYGGLTPADGEAGDEEGLRSRHAEILDHRRLNGMEGLLTVVGVKYTTARRVAEQTVDHVYQKLGRTPPPCPTRGTPLPGAKGFEGEDALVRAASAALGSEGGAEPGLLLDYGTRFRQVLGDVGSAPEGIGKSVFHLCCQHAVRAEMAVRLADVIFRRTDLAARGALTEADLQWCADMMSRELGWTAAHKEWELRDVCSEGARRFFRPLPGKPASARHGSAVTEQVLCDAMSGGKDR
jgi:glycerol-3-phosphate dehydrogenase